MVSSEYFIWVDTINFGCEIECKFIEAIPLCLDVKDLGGQMLLIIKYLIAPANSGQNRTSCAGVFVINGHVLAGAMFSCTEWQVLFYTFRKLFWEKAGELLGDLIIN